MTTITSREYVIRACAVLRLDLIAPKRGNPGILAYDFSVKPCAPCVIDALTWDDARKQLDAYNRTRAA